jgi:hypothetical protein
MAKQKFYLMARALHFSFEKQEAEMKKARNERRLPVAGMLAFIGISGIAMLCHAGMEGLAAAANASSAEMTTATAPTLDRMEYVNSLDFSGANASADTGFDTGDSVFLKEKDVYGYIGKRLREIVPEDAILTVSEFDESSGVFRPRFIIGLDKVIGIIKIIGKDPMKMSGDFGPVVKNELSTGKLQKANIGLHDIDKTVPESVSRMVEKFLGIKVVYVIGVVREGKVVGGLSIILRQERELSNPSVIEAFAARAAIAIAKWKAEQALLASD